MRKPLKPTRSPRRAPRSAAVEPPAKAAFVVAPQLEVKDLRVVLAIASAGTTAAAAVRLHLTQSAVSRALALAERHAGVQLFERTPSGLVPTAAGQWLEASAARLLADLTAVEQSLRLPVEIPERVRLVAECYMVYPWLAPAAVRLRRTLPRLSLAIAFEHTHQAVSALASGKVDVALLTSKAPARMLSRPLFEDEIVFLVAQDHPLAARPHIEPADLLSHTLLVSTNLEEARWFCKKVFGRPSVALDAYRLPVTEALVELARAGLGIAVLSEWVARAYLNAPDHGLRVLRLRSGPLSRSWILAYPRSASGVSELLLEAVVAARPSTPTLG